MDYDDNDFQCQNFHLVGEDNNKFPPSLQTVPLPKFDLDEHLQAHLRFDSLVETEVLLGIQGRENNWIEDFSPGDGAIEFSSSAAESCPISRHNNVWSEATSSESVEMLLKSVGEDEMIDQKTIIKEVAAHDDLNGKDGQSDTFSRQNNSQNSRQEDIIHTDAALSPDNFEKNFLGLDEDAVRVQPQIEGMPQTSNDEKFGTGVDVSSLGEKCNSEGKSVANECSMDKSLTSSSDYAANRSLVIDVVFCETSQNDNPLHDTSLKTCATDDSHCIVSAVAGDNCDSITCSTQDVPSSVSTSILVIDPVKLNTPMLSEQVIEEYSEIDTSEKFGMLSSQKESSHIRDSKVNDRLPQGPAVRSRPCSAKGSSILESTMDSLALVNEGCNEPAFSENPDGLLEAITYQVKALNEESQSMDIISPETKESYNLVMEGDKIIENKSVRISNEDDASNVLSTLSVKNTDMVESHEGRENSLVEATEEKQDHEVQLTENSNNNIENTSQSTVKVHSSFGMSYAVPTKERKYDDGLGFSLLNLTSQHPNCVVIPEYSEIVVVKDIVKQAEVKLNAPQDDLLEESSSPALVDDAEKTSSSLPRKSFDMCDPDKLVAEMYVVHKIPPKISAFTKDNTTPPVNSENAHSNVDISFINEKMQSVSSTDLKIPVSTVIDCSSAKKLVEDESVGAKLHFLDNSAIVHQPQPEDTPDTDVFVEQKEPTTPPLPASGFIQPDENDVETSENTSLDRSLDVQISRESFKVSEPVVVLVDDSSMKDMIHDEPGVNSLIKFQQSESEDTMAVDVVVEQKEEATPGLHVLDFIDSDEKGVSCLSVSKGTMNTQIVSGLAAVSSSVNDSSQPQVSPSEILPIVVGQSSSSMEGSVYVGCQNELQSSVDNPVMHEHPTRLEENLTAHAFVRGNGNSESPVESASKGEREALPIPLSKNYSSGDCNNRQENSEANVAPGDNCQRQNGTTQTEGDAQTRCTNSSPDSLTLPRSTNESHLLEAEHANPSSSEQKFGSPIAISCSGHTQDETYQNNNSRLPDQRDPLSNDLLVGSSKARVNVDKLKSNAHVSKESAVSEDEKSFTFEVGSLEDLPEKGTGNEWKPFSSMPSFEHSQMAKENSEGRLPESEEVELRGKTTQAHDEDNSRQVSRYSTEKLTTKQGKAAKKTPIPKKITERDRNSCSNSPKSVGTTNGNMPLEEMQHYPYIESNLRASCTPTVQSSSLPDLNTSVSAAALFRQPFTDLQQLQLRAQIFVYGSLIQGIPPDEACMISAFGETVGGRRLWEGVWRVSAERYQNQTSPFSSCETPSLSRSGTRVSEQVTRCSSLPNKASSIPASRIGSKVVSTAVLNSTVPLPSPLWSISTCDELHYDMPRVTHLDFNQAPSPLHSHQSSQRRQYTGNSASWLAQTTRPGSRVVSSQSLTLDAATRYSALPVVEAVQVTPVRDSSISHALNVQTVSPIALLPTTGPACVSAASAVHIGTPKKTTTAENNRSASTVQKSRKRKKGSVPEEPQLNILVPQPVAEPATPTGDLVSTKIVPSGLVSTTSTTISPTYYKIIGSSDPENMAIFSEETCSKIEQAKLIAEDAAALAASTVKHSQGIWSQLATLKNSGLVSEVDEKLASAAVAAAAAVSVAKAAAAAAKVASDAALQAKMMADEALVSVKALAKNSEIDLQSLTRLTTVSVLKGKDKDHGSSSIISAVREAARRRLESASAATKRAENLDAIVKAAELAAEAVSQAGSIIAMGEPLPFTLSELVEAGPEGHWKFYSTSNEHDKTKGLAQVGHTSLDGSDNPDKYAEQFEKQFSNNKETQKTTDEEGMLSFSEHSVQSEKHQKGNGSSNAPSTVPTDRHEKDNSSINHLDNSVQKGSLVEVVSDEDGLRGVWFSARVLDVNDSKAYVCYIDHRPDEGTGQRKEWILLEGEVNKAPRIRPARPMTAAKYEGTRKRRREAIGNHVWGVGDRVDAWIRDGWWEGIVTEKSQGDDTKLTVNFPASGDLSIVRAWNLRPSLVWKDGQWMEWSRARDVSLPQYEGDTPREKRQRLGRVETMHSKVDGKGVGELANDLPVDDSCKPEESRPLMLSAKDKTFSVGKNGGAFNSAALKVRHNGLKKGGSKVVFGVPQHGKKRKFMEVSKVPGRTEKISEGTDSIKLTKYLMPQSSRIWRNTSRMDPKEKSVSDSRPKVLKALKSQNIQAKSIGVKDNLSVTAASNGGETGHTFLPNTRAGFSNEQINLEKKSLPEVGSFANYLGTIESPHVEPSVQPVPGVPPSRKKSSSAVEVGIGIKGKLTPAVDKSIKREEKGYENPGKTISVAAEPRRSNRRIQPTSRLLEGLQSSLIVSKIPNLSYDKSTKAQQHRAASSSRGNTHG